MFGTAPFVDVVVHMLYPLSFIYYICLLTEWKRDLEKNLVELVRKPFNSLSGYHEAFEWLAVKAYEEDCETSSNKFIRFAEKHFGNYLTAKLLYSSDVKKPHFAVLIQLKMTGDYYVADPGMHVETLISCEKQLKVLV